MTSKTTIDQVVKAHVLEALRGVFDPELGSDVVDLGMVREIDIDGDVVTIGLALTIAECPMRDQIEQDTVRKVTAIPGVADVIVQTRAMTKAQRTELMGVARRRARENATPTQISPTTRVIAIGSGKGGVGKSSVSVNIALAMKDLGFRVGLLDADIWGFSIPRMVGSDSRIEADGETRLMNPVEDAGDQGGVDRTDRRIRRNGADVAGSHAFQGTRAIPPAGRVGRPRLPRDRHASRNRRYSDGALTLASPGRDGRGDDAPEDRPEGGDTGRGYGTPIGNARRGRHREHVLFRGTRRWPT